MTIDEIKPEDAAKILGRAGGIVTSKKKARAAVINGAKGPKSSHKRGGRPKGSKNKPRDEHVED